VTTTTLKLLDAWKAARKLGSDSEAARALQVSASAICNWRHGRSHADAPLAEKMAKDLGLEVLPVLAAIEADRATREEARRTWARYGRGAFIAVCMMAGTISPSETRAEGWNESSIMRSRKKRYPRGGVESRRRRKTRPNRKARPRITSRAKAYP